MKKERLDKLIASQGLLSRSDVKNMVRCGEVSVNGIVVKDSSLKVTYEDDIKIKGESLLQTEFTYIMLNKPKGVVSASEDKRDKTVVDILPDDLKRKNLFPAGRLDKNTTGLLLLTNDGATAHRLTSPKHHVDKVYAFTVKFPISEEDVKALCRGVTLEDGYETLPCTVEMLSEREGRITLREGKYHQIKRMMIAVHNQITSLTRISYGPLTTKGLSEGQWRYLTDEEIKLITNNN